MPRGVQGFVLDLTRTGVHPWVDALAAGRRPPRSMGAVEFEHELRTILPNWFDDERLRRSALWEAGLVAGESDSRAAADLREVVRTTLQRLERSTDAYDHLAYRALELAYLTPRVSNEAAAERLSVSRATFYRLLKRGIRGLAMELSAPPA